MPLFLGPLRAGPFSGGRPRRFAKLRFSSEPQQPCQPASVTLTTRGNTTAGHTEHLAARADRRYDSCPFRLRAAAAAALEGKENNGEENAGGQPSPFSFPTSSFLPRQIQTNWPRRCPSCLPASTGRRDCAAGSPPGLSPRLPQSRENAVHPGPRANHRPPPACRRETNSGPPR